MRWRNHGSVDIVLKSWDRRQPKYAHIWDFVDKDGPVPPAPWCSIENNCWLWTGYTDKDDYGWLSGIPAHRRIYEIVKGTIPNELTLDHLCRVHQCVRPEHLEAVTRAENIRRAVSVITHCPAGHEYNYANTHVNRKGHRFCRTCARDRARARTLKLKESA